MLHSYVCVVVGAVLAQHAPGQPTVVVDSTTHWGRMQPGGVTSGGQGLILVEVTVGQGTAVVVIVVVYVVLVRGQVEGGGLAGRGRAMGLGDEKVGGRVLRGGVSG